MILSLRLGQGTSEDEIAKSWTNELIYRHVGQKLTSVQLALRSVKDQKQT